MSKIDFSGITLLDPGDIVEMDIKDLRNLPVEDLIKLMHELGLSTIDINERAEALTKLMNTAVEA